MKTILITLSLLITITSFAQSLKQNVADKHYATLAYEKCAPMYAELAEKKNAPTDIIRKAAISYSKLNVPTKAEVYFHQLSTKSDVQPTDYYNYAQTLLSNGKYKEADEMMKKFYNYSDINSVAKRYYKVNPDYEKTLKKDSLKFSIKQLEGINSAESDFAPVYFNNKSQLVYTTNRENHGASNKEFAWDNTNFLDLYKAKIDTAKQTSEKPEKFDKSLKTEYHDGPIAFSPDGKTMLLTRSNYFDDKIQKSSTNVINIQLYYTKKEGDNWGALKPFPYNNKDYNFGQACFAPDGKTIYFASDMPGSYGYTDIWETNFDGTSFTQPKNLGQEVNTEGREMFPFVDDEGLLLFASDGHVGLGGLDIHLAKLMGSEAVYITNAGYPINTNFDDFGFIYDNTTLKGFFTSNRTGGKGKDDIYAVKLKEPFVQKKVLKGKVIDEVSKDPIPFASINITDDKGNVIETLKADDKGDFSALIPKDANIQTLTKKEGYNPNQSNTLAYNDIPKDPITIPLNKQDFRLDGLVLDSKTKEPLEGVKVSILDAVTNKDGILKLTDEKGDFKLNLNDKKNEERIKYIIHIEKDGYEPKDIVVEKTRAEMDANPIIKVIETLSSPRISPYPSGTNPETGGDFMAIEPIFFDLDKSDIRPDAQEQLDKLVATLNARKDIKIEISSSTDCRATNAYNMALSQRRANTTAEYLVSKGISKSRLKLKWTGENNLTTNCPCEPTNESACSEEQHQLNRRSNFKVTDYKIKGADAKIKQ
jgi:outer membrane protein OmpA-like peptidoglycan-associated protein